MANSGPHSRQLDVGEAAAQVVVEQADELGVERDLGAAAAQVGDHPQQAAGGDRGEPEHDDVGEPGVGGEPDRVRVPGTRRIARGVGWHRLDGEAVGLDHPLDLLGVRDVEVGELHRRRPYRRPRRYRHRRSMYRFLLTPRWIAFHLLVVAAIVAMINLGFWQLRRLDERQAFNEAVSSRIDLPPEPLTDVMSTGPTIAGIEWRSVEASGTYLPDEEFVVVNRSEGGVAGDLVVTPMLLDDGRILLVQRGFVPLGETAAPAPSGEVDIVGRLREPQVRRRGQVSDPSEGELTEVQRIDFDRLAPQLPGQPRADVGRAGVVGPGRGRPVPATRRRARARRRSAPVLRRAVVHLLDRRRGRLGAGRAQVDQRPPNGFATRRRRIDHGSAAAQPTSP